MRFKKPLLIFSLVLANSIWGQQFYKSKGLQLFNQHSYAAASDSMVLWAQDYMSEKGIAFYYAGECQYNLAFDARGAVKIRDCFEKAADFFRTALKQTDLSVLYPEKKAETTYKLAWTCYRLAELDNEPLRHLKNAAQYFSESASLGNDSLKTVSRYMIAETNLRKAQWLRIQMHLSGNTGSAINAAQEAVLCLDEAIEVLERINKDPNSVENLQAPVRLKMLDLYFEMGRCYVKMPVSVFVQLNNRYRENTPEMTAQAIYRNRVNYRSVLTSQETFSRNRLLAITEYSETIKRLQLFLLTNLEKDKQALNTMLDSLRASVYPAEKAMIQGIRDLKANVQDEAFLRLTDPKTSFFSKAGSEISESGFWMGMAQYLANDPQSSNTFDHYLRNTENQLGDLRIRLLREEARYLSFLMQFDHNSGQKTVLLRLKKELELFQSTNSTIKEKSNLLLQLVRLSLGETIWGKILNASSQEERFNDAFNLIQDAMVRATRVTGRERAPYLRFLDELFKITQYKKPEETAFYRGMALFLKAEIQETGGSKRDLYRAAAEAMKSVGGKFRNEANYIQARSLFAGAKHGTRSNEDYNDAKPIFVDLINHARSLRSVFYLGEIFRVQGNDLAASRCYQIVADKTNELPEGSFWYQNAVAGMGLCKSQGDVSILQQIQIAQVQFPEVLLQNVDGETISLERFADYDYIRRQYHDQAIDLYVRFGLPKRDLYPSEARIEESRFARRDYYPHSAGIQEKLGNIASGLKLFVLLPQGIQNDAAVTVAGLALMKDGQGFYSKAPIPLNESEEIRVFHRDCYPFIEDHVFAQPGTERMIVPLIRKEKYVEIQQEIWKGNAIRFSKRSDRNIVFLPSHVALLPSASMIRDFEKDVALRDFAFSQDCGGYIAVHAKRPNPILYRNGSKSEFVLNYPKEHAKLKSPEGIAVDSKGNVYVVDWSGHQVMVFNNQGNFIRAIGSFGRNFESDTGKPVRFEFPMRIAILEDMQGVMINGQRVFLPINIFVSDRNGIQFLNAQGLFLTSLVSNGFEAGSLSSVMVDEYNQEMKIGAFNRQTNSIVQFASGSVRKRP